MPARCAWVGEDKLLTQYHDREWGVPEFDSRAVLESLMLRFQNLLGLDEAATRSDVLENDRVFTSSRKSYTLRLDLGCQPRTTQSIMESE